MTNPYQSPHYEFSEEELPRKIRWRFASLAALFSLAMIACAVTTAGGYMPLLVGIQLGILCFLLAFASALASSYRRPLRRAALGHALTSKMLAEQSGDYHEIMRMFALGSRLVYQGIVFQKLPTGEGPSWLRASSAIAAAEEPLAWRMATYIEQVTGELRGQSREFHEITSGCRFTMAFFRSYERIEEHLGTIVGSELIWTGGTDPANDEATSHE